MPTVKAKANGRLIVVSRKHGRFNTVQLTQRGEQLIRDQLGEPEGAQIGHGVLAELLRQGDAYTKRSRREQRPTRHARRTFAEVPPAPELIAKELAERPTVPTSQVRRCSHCQAITAPGAAFCARCGRAMGPKKEANAEAWLWVGGLVMIVVIVLLCAHSR